MLFLCDYYFTCIDLLCCNESKQWYHYLQIGGMAFVFEINSKSVRQHLANATKIRKQNNIKFERSEGIAWVEEGRQLFPLSPILSSLGEEKSVLSQSTLELDVPCPTINICVYIYIYIWYRKFHLFSTNHVYGYTEYMKCSWSFI